MSGISGHILGKEAWKAMFLNLYLLKHPTFKMSNREFHPDAKDYYLDDLRNTIKKIGANKIAALLMEPINGSSGERSLHLMVTGWRHKKF